MPRHFTGPAWTRAFQRTRTRTTPIPHGIAARPLNNRDGIRISTALAYLDMARHRLNLTVRANVQARRVLFEGSRAVGIEAESGGEVFTAEADQIILSGGAINSPQLLMLSGVGPSDHLGSLGIDLVHDLPGVGQNLRDHPAVFMLFRSTGEAPGVMAPSIQVGLRYTVEGSDTRNDMQVSPLLMTSEHRPANVQVDSNDNHFGISIGLQLAVGSGEIRLTSTDPGVQPHLNYNYLSEPWDRERMRKAVRLAIRLSQHPAFKDIIVDRLSPSDADMASDDALDDWLLRSVGTQHHSSGTCKMGPGVGPYGGGGPILPGARAGGL